MAFLFPVMLFAGEFTGKFTSGDVIVVLNQEVSGITGDLFLDGMTYHLNGKEVEGIAYFEIIGPDMQLVGNVKMTISNGVLKIQKLDGAGNIKGLKLPLSLNKSE